MPRAEIAMTPDEIAAFLAEEHRMQLATCRRDGMPHIVTMWYCLVDDRIAFWTYAKAQKSVNLRRNPRVACLIEAGWHPSEVRGVEIEGHATLIEDRQRVWAIGRAIARRGLGIDPDDETMLAMGAAKRVAFVVEPVRIASWDHRKIPGGYLSDRLPGATSSA